MRKSVTLLAAAFLANGVMAGSASASPSGGALPPALTLVVQVAGLNGVPDDAVGVAMNVTATGPSAPGFLTVYPCGDVPTASNVNYVQDQTVPNFVVSALSPDGAVCIDTFAVVDVVVDLAGYLPAASPIVTLPQPSRVVDSRQGIGLPGPLTAGQVAEIQVAGTPGIPADASSVLFNATVTNTAAPGFLAVFPCGESIPPTSTLNFKANDTVPNFVVAKIGNAGRVCLYSTSDTQVIVDVAGYSPAGSTDVVPLPSPARLFDTRIGIGGSPGKLTTAGRSVQLGGVANIPTTATAVVVNLTATQSVASGFVSAYPCGAAAPLVSNLNFSPGTDVANMAIVKLGAGGQLCFTSNYDVDVIADVTGYLNNDSSITALTPLRIYDSREGVDPQCNIGVRVIPTGYEFVDLKTGAVTGVAPNNGVQSPRIHVTADCQHIDIAGFDPSTGHHLWTYDRLAQLISIRPLPEPADNVIFTDLGPVVLHHDFLASPPIWEVVDLASAQLLFALPELQNYPEGGQRFWEAVGVSSDGGLIALSYPSIDKQGVVLTYWTPDGVELGEWKAPLGAFNFRLSPGGSYLAFTVSSGVGIFGNTVVVGLDGSPVTSMPSGILGIGQWISDGSLLTCSRDNSPSQWPARWDLFSPVKDLIPGNPYRACLFTAR